jgi:hypothetical protein
MCERQLDLVENRTRVMRAPTRGLAKALRGIYWGGGGGASLPPPPAKSYRNIRDTSPRQWLVCCRYLSKAPKNYHYGNYLDEAY